MKNSVLHRNRLEDKKISIALMSSFAMLTIQYLVLIIFKLIGTSTGHIIQLTSKGLVGFFYILALPAVLQRNKIKCIGIYFTAIFVFIFHYMVFAENQIYLKLIISPLFFTCLPSLIFAYSISDWEVLVEVMKRVGNIVFLVGVILGFLVLLDKVSVGSYSMSLSYYMLLPTIIYLNEFLDEFSFKKGFALLILFFIILGLGSRGAVLSIGVFGILKILKSFKKMTYKKVLILCIIFSLTIAGFAFLNKTLDFMYSFFRHFGINSRSIALFLRESIHLSGRENIYDKVFSETLKNPLLGLGLAGDRMAIGGGYAHNIFIEILANFGVIAGTFLSIALLYIISRPLFIEDTKKSDMAIIWISIGFIPLLVSGSYLTDLKFWIMTGLLLSLNQKCKLKLNI